MISMTNFTYRESFLVDFVNVTWRKFSSNWAKLPLVSTFLCCVLAQEPQTSRILATACSSSWNFKPSLSRLVFTRRRSTKWLGGISCITFLALEEKKREWSLSSCWNEKFRYHLLRRSGNLKFVIMIVSDQNKLREMCTTGALCSCVFEKLWSQNSETWANLANGERTNLWGDFKRSDALLLNICVHVCTQQSKPA